MITKQIYTHILKNNIVFYIYKYTFTALNFGVKERYLID